MNGIKRLRAGLIAGVLAVAITPGMVRADEMSNEAGMGALAAFSTLVYAPAKLVYATSGLLFGGIAWGLSGGDHDVMKAVVTPSIMGDYVITPAHLRLERRLEFFGQDPAYRPAHTASVAQEEPLILSEDFPEDY